MTTTGAQIDQLKLERLQATAQGGAAGRAQYDAAQSSVAQEKAAQAAGLASDARSAGYAGPSLGGAPVALGGQLNSYVDPYSTAISGAKTAFGQDLAQGAIASLRYMDAVKAAEAPSLAAKGSGGGSGGGGGGSSVGKLTDTQLRNALIAAAARARSDQVGAINQSEAKAAGAYGQAINRSSVDPGITAAAGLFGVTPGQGAPAPAGGGFGAVAAKAGQGVSSGPSFADELASKAAAVKALYEQRVARQQRVETSPIVPLATQIGTQSGVDPLKLSEILGPSQEATYQRALAATLPKLTTPKLPKAEPVPFEQAAQQLGISADAGRKALGVKYSYPQPNGKVYTGSIVNDVIAAARTAFEHGYDETSFATLLDQNAPRLARALKLNPDAANFAGAVIQGFWPAPPPAAVTNPYQRYYEQQYPPVALPR